MSALCDRSAVELRRLIVAKEISPVELLASCFERIDEVNDKVNAFVALCRERAEAEAQEAEAAVLRGEALGSLHGLPIGIKDLTLTEGLVTTFGSPQFTDFVPEADERQVAAMRAAGAIVIGKTNTPEFGAGANTVNPVYGATGNPFDPEKTSAGSSGGSAAALATGMVPLANGSDMGGSLRNPAAYCGIVGMRPSPGGVADETTVLGWSSLGVQGPMARSVEDLALLYQAMAAEDHRDPLSYPINRGELWPLADVDLGELNVAISEDLGFAPVDNDIRATFKTAIAKLEPAFASARQVDPPLAGADEAFEVTRALSFVAAHKATYDENPDILGPNIVANVEQGLLMSLTDVARAMAAHTALYRRFVAFMEDYDILICPAMSVPPFPHGQLYPTEINGEPLRTYFHWLALAYGLTLTSHPVVCLPAGLDHTGMPFGIQICGKRGSDAHVLAISRALEHHMVRLEGLGRPVPDLDRLKT
ncbi:MAG: amidase family protein [Alphaproteobacteria bacterium]|nr:amidase family protein [Alphaproteobacteria bacterium]